EMGLARELGQVFDDGCVACHHAAASVLGPTRAVTAVDVAFERCRDARQHLLVFSQSGHQLFLTVDDLPVEFCDLDAGVDREVAARGLFLGAIPTNVIEMLERETKRVEGSVAALAYAVVEM